MKNYKTKKKSGALKAIAAVALSAVLLSGGGAVGYGAATDWKYKKGDMQTSAPDNGGSEINNEQNSMVISEVENKDANFSARTLKASEYREYDIDAQSVESAYAATVTLANHSDATDKSITLTAEFADGQSASEYIGFSATTVQSGAEFTITCKQAFGQQITIKATANGVESGAKPSCSIKADYVRRFKAIYMTGGNVSSSGGANREPYFEKLRLSSGSGSDKGEMFVYTDDDLASIFINTNLDSVNDVSVGTITEGIKDVKISYTYADSSGDEILWDKHKAETNLYETNPPSDLSHLFYYLSDDDYMETFGQIVDFAKAQAGNYTEALSKYNKKEASLTLAVQFTGKITGITYTFTSDVVVNPAGLYTAAQNPSFDPNTNGGIIF